MRSSARAIVALVAAFGGAPLLPAAEGPLSLSETVELAMAQSPRIAAQRARFEGASVGIVAAGALPDPKLKTTLDSVPTNTEERWTAKDDHTMLTVSLSQEFPGGNKRELRTERAEADARREQAMIEVERAAVARDAALAWIARHYADEAEARVADQIAEAELAVETASGQYRSGRIAQVELIALQGAVAELKNRRAEIAVQGKRARIVLARYIGPAADRALAAPPDFERPPPSVADGLDADALPDVRSALAQEMVAAKDADLALAENWPDWMVEWSYGWRGRAGEVEHPGHPAEPGTPWSQLTSLEVEVGLPFFTRTRQEPRHAAKEKELDAARGKREKARRRQSADVESMLTEWESARTQALRIRDELIPLAVQSRDAALAAYRGGTGSLDAVLQARRALLNARLALVQQEQAAGKAWTWLAYVYPAGGRS